MALRTGGHRLKRAANDNGSAPTAAECESKVWRVLRERAPQCALGDPVETMEPIKEQKDTSQIHAPRPECRTNVAPTAERDADVDACADDETDRRPLVDVGPGIVAAWLGQQLLQLVGTDGIRPVEMSAEEIMAEVPRRYDGPHIREIRSLARGVYLVANEQFRAASAEFETVLIGTQDSVFDDFRRLADEVHTYCERRLADRSDVLGKFTDHVGSQKPVVEL